MLFSDSICALFGACVVSPDGKQSGEAFVVFKSTADGQKAITRNKATMGERYIDVFPAAKVRSLCFWRYLQGFQEVLVDTEPASLLWRPLWCCGSFD